MGAQLSWLPVPLHPEYEVNARYRVRKTRSRYEIAKTRGRVRLVGPDGAVRQLNAVDLWAWANDPAGHSLARLFAVGADAKWLPVPLYPEYEVSADELVRNVLTGKLLKAQGVRKRYYNLVLNGTMRRFLASDILAMARDPHHPLIAKLQAETEPPAEPKGVPQEDPKPAPVTQSPKPDETEEAPTSHAIPASTPFHGRTSLTGCPWQSGRVRSDSEWDWAGIL